ncbi:FixH family protein [Alkalicoccobacillus plakortidis]|uniref:FixH family protein n=1 Tax=Alkalicoccobacillus plakortidis TaxID=444060 RepID=A0ABT0XLB9_9BACI|nr:FixH family protein [Alkalicoccobacillus plakortidis]MCM2676701.1 FixH family protein [Alkalicoccobacillus plakortidis]
MLEKTQTKEYGQIIAVMIVLMIVLFYGLFYPSLTVQEDQWQIHEVHVAEGYRPYRVEKVQLFLEDTQGRPMENGQVQFEVSHVETGITEKQWMHHVEQGLFETDYLFTESGEWQVQIEVSNNRSQQQFTYSLMVQPGATKMDPSENRK